MRLHPDCIRDILLTVEENTGYDTPMDIGHDTKYPLLAKYDIGEVLYHIKQCESSGLIEIEWFLSSNGLIEALTPYGHQLLVNIRAEHHWTKIKSIAKEIDTFTIDALIKTAANVVSSAVPSKF